MRKMERQVLKQSSQGLNEVFLFIKIKIVWAEILINGRNGSRLPSSLVCVPVYTFNLWLVSGHLNNRPIP